MDAGVRALLKDAAVTGQAVDPAGIRRRARRRGRITAGLTLVLIVAVGLLVADVLTLPLGRNIELAPADRGREPADVNSVMLSTPLPSDLDEVGMDEPVAAWVDDDTPIYLVRDDEGWYGVSALSGHRWFGLPTLIAPCQGSDGDGLLFQDALGASVFSAAGSYINGPAHADLDRWSVSVVDGRFDVTGPQVAEGRDATGEGPLNPCQQPAMGAEWVAYQTTLASTDAFPLPLHDTATVSIADLPNTGTVVLHAWHDEVDGGQIACEETTAQGRCPADSLVVSQVPQRARPESFIAEQWTYIEMADGEIVRAWPLAHGFIGENGTGPVPTRWLGTTNGSSST